MKKNVFGRHFKRDVNERKALFKNLLNALVLHERIETTEEKAKAVRSQADKLITKAKIGGVSAYRNLQPQVSHQAVEKLIKEIAPRFMTRQGGYTRIIKLGKRGGDNASMVLLEWTERVVNLPKLNIEPEKAKKSAKKSTFAKVTADKEDKKKEKKSLLAKIKVGKAEKKEKKK